MERHITRDLKDVAAFLFVNVLKASLVYIKIRSHVVIPLFDLVGDIVAIYSMLSIKPQIFPKAIR